MTKQGERCLPLNSGAAPERLLSPNGQGMSRFAGCLLVSFVALLLIGCWTTADLMPPGPVAPIPRDSIVVFGKIELKTDVWFERRKGVKSALSPFRSRFTRGFTWNRVGK